MGYNSEAGRNGRMLNTFERKVLRVVFGLDTIDSEGKTLGNHELYFYIRTPNQVYLKGYPEEILKIRREILEINWGV